MRLWKQTFQSLAVTVLSLVLVVGPSLSLVGCAVRVTHVTNLPPGVSEQEVKNWYTATGTLHKIADVTHAVQEAVISFNHAGVFPDGPAYVATLQDLGKIKILQEDSAKYLATVPQTFGQPTKDKLKSNMTAISALIQDMNTRGITGIKNADSAKSINAQISQLILSASVLLSLF